MIGSMTRLKNRLIARVITWVPFLAKGFIEAYKPWESEDVPWAPVQKPLAESVVALVTTAGVHQKDQKAFDMRDKNGDPTFREIDAGVSAQDLMITHDYYDHADADKDIDIVFPLTRIREFAAKGLIQGIARTNYGFMGHITGGHIFSLMHESAPEVAARLHRDKVDCVLLTPG